jgi:hypothetical protein
MTVCKMDAKTAPNIGMKKMYKNYLLLEKKVTPDIAFISFMNE